MVAIVDNFTFNSANESSNLVLTKPTDIVAGDLLLIIASNDDYESGNGSDFSTLSGWNMDIDAGDSGCDCRLAIFSRIATGDANDKDETIAIDTGPDEILGWYLRITGASTATGYINNTSSATTSTTTVSSFNAPSLITTVDDCLVIAVVGFDGTDGYPFTPSGTDWPSSIATNQEYREPQSVFGGGTSAAWVTKILATAGASSSCSFAASATDTMLGVQIAIAPSAISSTTHSIVLSEEVESTVLGYAAGFTYTKDKGETGEEIATVANGGVTAITTAPSDVLRHSVLFPIAGEATALQSIEVDYNATAGDIRATATGNIALATVNKLGTVCT